MKRIKAKLTWIAQYLKVTFQMSSPLVRHMKTLNEITSKVPWPVYCCDDVVTAFGMRTDLPQALAVKQANGRKFIVVTKRFLELPQWYQDGALAHEAGHIELGHIDEPDALEVRVMDDLKAEMDADRYAIEHNMGCALLGYLEELQKKLNHPDLTARIHVLMSECVIGPLKRSNMASVDLPEL